MPQGDEIAALKDRGLKAAYRLRELRRQRNYAGKYGSDEEKAASQQANVDAITKAQAEVDEVDNILKQKADSIMDRLQRLRQRRKPSAVTNA